MKEKKIFNVTRIEKNIHCGNARSLVFECDGRRYVTSYPNLIQSPKKEIIENALRNSNKEFEVEVLFNVGAENERTI